jgi:YVTN family beta-propeller protein
MKYLTNSGKCPAAKKQKFSAIGMLSALATAGGFLFFGQLGVAQSPYTSEISGLINPAAAAYNPATGKTYIVDPDGGAVTISDDAAHISVHVKVGAGPVSIAADSANGRAYVANADDGTVSVIDGKTDAVIASLTIGSHPYSIPVAARSMSRAPTAVNL